MTKTKALVDTLEYFSGSIGVERVLRFKTQDGTAVVLKMKLSAPEGISDKDWETAQFRFQDVQKNAVQTFQSELFSEQH